MGTPYHQHENTRGAAAVRFSVKNKLLLAGYAVLFFGLVASYDLYRENTWLVLLATSLILIGGLLAWLASIRPGTQK